MCLSTKLSVCLSTKLLKPRYSSKLFVCLSERQQNAQTRTGSGRPRTRGPRSVATTRLAPPAAFRRVLLTWLPAWLSRMQCAPSADRNKEPIAAVLAKYAPFAGGTPAMLLEVASGTGQHAAHLATAFPHVVWQPTEFAGGSAGPESPAYGDLSPV